MLINENKLRHLIRNVIKEMSLKFGGIHPVTGILNPDMNITNATANRRATKRNRFPVNAPEKFQKKLGWILDQYKGCTIHSYMFPADFDMNQFILNHLDEIPDSRINDMIEYNDVGIARVMDITDRVDDLIYELSKEFDVNDPTVQKFFQVLQESNQLISDDKNGVFIYFGGHTIDHGDPPSPYNMMHQVVDSSRFQDDHDVARISILLDNAITYDGKNASEDPGFFEGRAQSQSYGLQAVYNLIFQAAGWLDPDTGMILSNNPTNLGTKGLSDEADIVRRCLAPKYKNDTQLIQYMVTAGFVGLLRKVITKFWNMFRGRIIVTFSNDPL